MTGSGARDSRAHSVLSAGNAGQAGVVVVVVGNDELDVGDSELDVGDSELEQTNTRCAKSQLANATPAIGEQTSATRECPN